MFKRNVKITRLHNKERKEFQDTILIESPIDIFVNSEPLVNIICLPKDLKELAYGFLFSVGIINSTDDVKDITISELENSIFVELQDTRTFKVDDIDMNPVGRIIDTTCGIPSPWRKLIKHRLEESKVKEKLWSKEAIAIKSNIIFTAIKEMRLVTPLYRETGGCHGAGIFDIDGNLLSAKEDVGRHNAIDKVIGEILLNNQSFENVFLLSTGRLTSDSVLKAIRAKIPIVVSISAAIESGIKLAFAYGLTLIGFARGKRMNIYTHPERIEI
ncbi:MAG: formate dehydrogenase accessory sulfurtransferase FdhD [Promethearchaeota archaeon]